MTRRAWRWWISAGLALFAGFATISGLDRLSEHQPGAARYVPPMVRSHAARAAAARALAEGDIVSAESSARQAIDADPLDRRGPAYLAAAQAMAGRDAAADRGAAMASALSRREPLTQSYLYGSAMERRDYPMAARQLDILLRAHPEFPAAPDFLSQLEATPAGRAALLDRLRRDPAWADAYLEGYGANDTVLQKRAATLLEGADRFGLGCRHLEPMIRALERQGLRSEARRLQNAHCSGIARSGEGAEANAAAAGQFANTGWQRHLGGDVEIGTSGGGERAIILASQASVTRLMLSRPVALEPGAYRASARVKGAEAERLVASLTCAKAARPARGAGALGRGQVLHAGRCEDLVIAIWLRPGTGAVTLDDFRLEPVEPADLQSQSPP